MSGGSHVSHHPHTPENKQQKRVGIYISFLAVIMAVISAATHRQANEQIVKEVKASNGFAWYQSKRQRTYANDLELKRIELALLGTPTDGQLRLLQVHKTSLSAKNAEYESENKDILATAEIDRAAAMLSGHRHHWFEYSEICLQVAVVLCSLVLLTDQKLFLHLGFVAMLIGIVIALWAQLGIHEHPASSRAGTNTSAPATQSHH